MCTCFEGKLQTFQLCLIHHTDMSPQTAFVDLLWFLALYNTPVYINMSKMLSPNHFVLKQHSFVSFHIKFVYFLFLPAYIFLFLNMATNDLIVLKGKTLGLKKTAKKGAIIYHAILL